MYGFVYLNSENKQITFLPTLDQQDLFHWVNFYQMYGSKILLIIKQKQKSNGESKNLQA